MVNVVSKALGWATSTFPRGVLIDIDAIGKYSDERLVICTTGSQGRAHVRSVPHGHERSPEGVGKP